MDTAPSPVFEACDARRCGTTALTGRIQALGRSAALYPLSSHNDDGRVTAGTGENTRHRCATTTCVRLVLLHLNPLHHRRNSNRTPQSNLPRYLVEPGRCLTCQEFFESVVEPPPQQLFHDPTIASKPATRWPA